MHIAACVYIGLCVFLQIGVYVYECIVVSVFIYIYVCVCVCILKKLVCLCTSAYWCLVFI